MPTLLYSLADAFLTDCCKAVKGTALVCHTVSKHMAQQVQVWRPGQSPSAPPTDKAVHPSAAIRAVHVLRAPLRDDRLTSADRASAAAVAPAGSLTTTCKAVAGPLSRLSLKPATQAQKVLAAVLNFRP
jgi:hypothetical protein